MEAPLQPLSGGPRTFWGNLKNCRGFSHYFKAFGGEGDGSWSGEDGAFSCLDLKKNWCNLSEKWPLAPWPSSLLALIGPSGAPEPLIEASEKSPYRSL